MPLPGLCSSRRCRRPRTRLADKSPHHAAFARHRRGARRRTGCAPVRLPQSARRCAIRTLAGRCSLAYSVRWRAKPIRAALTQRQAYRETPNAKCWIFRQRSSLPAVGLAGLAGDRTRLRSAVLSSLAPTSGPGATAGHVEELLEDEAGQDLKPHAMPLTVTPVEKIQLAKLKVPAGFQGRGLGARHARHAHDDPWRQGHGLRRHARHRQGLRHHRQGRAAQRTRSLLEGQQQPNGLAFKNGTLFVITIDKSLRFDGIEDKLDSPQVTDVSDKFNMPASDAPQLEVLRPSAPTASSIRRSARPATCARSTPACMA